LEMSNERPLLEELSFGLLVRCFERYCILSVSRATCDELEPVSFGPAETFSITSFFFAFVIVIVFHTLFFGFNVSIVKYIIKFNTP